MREGIEKDSEKSAAKSRKEYWPRRGATTHVQNETDTRDRQRDPGDNARCLKRKRQSWRNSERVETGLQARHCLVMRPFSIDPVGQLRSPSFARIAGARSTKCKPRTPPTA